MNIKKIKLALTVQLLNKHQSEPNVLESVSDTMKSFGDEVGNFIGFTILKDFVLGQDVVSRTYAMRYEKCTLNVDLVTNQHTQSEYLNGFTLS